MNLPDLKVSLADVISVIETRQAVLNKDDLTAAELQVQLTGIGNLINASQTQLSFLSDKSYVSSLSATKAAVVLVSDEPDTIEQVPNNVVALVVNSPYVAYASVTHIFDPLNNPNNSSDQNPLPHSRAYAKGQPNSHPKADSNSDSEIQPAHIYIHPTAEVAETAILEDQVYIGPYCVVGEHVHIGSGTRLQSQVHIEQQVIIGKNCTLYPHSYIGHDCRIGDKVRIHAGASIGSEGFGFAPLSNTATEGWERIVQLGRVVIGNQVRIGSQSCIDRGAIEDTIIEDNVIIDNLVQIGHNVKIGAGTAIAGKVGIAGSATIGKRCMIGGGVGIAGHLQICDAVVLTGMTMVSKSIKKPGVYSSGVSSMPAMDWRRAMVKLRAMGKK